MRATAWNLAAGSGLSLVFLLLLLIYGPVNIEQYHHSYPASLAFHSSLLEGRFLFWSDGFGFGTPLPLGENFNFHPLFLLTVFLPLRLVFSIFWLTHLTLGAVYFLRLCRRLEIVKPVSFCLLFSYVFSVATVNYSYLNDWPAIFLAWTLFPVLVFYLDHFIETEVWTAPWFGVARLALLFGFTVLNSHLGYLVVLFVVLLVFALVRSRLRPRVIAWLCLAASAILCLTAERLYFVASEMRRFPDGLAREAQDPYAAVDWVRELYRPMTGEIVDAMLDLDKERLSTVYLDRHKGLRVPFLGLVIFVTASATAFYVLSPSGRRHLPSEFLRASVACFLFSFVLSLLPSGCLLRIPSGMWFFRDPALLFGFLTAGKGLTLWHAARSPGAPWLKAILALQCVQLVLAMAPGMLVVYRHRGGNVQFYSGHHEETFKQWLGERTHGLGGRLYLSPRIARDLLGERAVYASLGLLGTGDFNRLGLAPVNGYFKGVSMDTLHPSLFLMMGFIPSDPTVIRSESIFDVLGIDFLLVRADELAAIGPEALGHLEPLGNFLVPDLKEPIILMRNQNAWPRAVLYPPAIAELDLDEMNCRGPGLLLCSDLSTLQELRLKGSVELLKGRDGSLSLFTERSDLDRVVVITLTYRSEWQAVGEKGDALRTMAIGEALLGVELPAGTGEVSVSFEPRWRQRLLFLEVGTALCCLALIARRLRAS